MDEILGAAVADGKVTPKVQSLIKILLRYQHTDDFRAIIFVERVVVAQILPKVHNKSLPGLGFFFQCSFLASCGSEKMSHDSVMLFSRGGFHLLLCRQESHQAKSMRLR